MKTLVTGANGFIGRALCARMITEGWQVRGSLRCIADKNLLPPGMEISLIESIGPDTDWQSTLAGMDAVVHLAARVHVMKEDSNDSLAAFRIVNTYGTEKLARMAQDAGVKKFIYMSSIKVNGEMTDAGPLTEQNPPNPQDPYAVSKLEAEQTLLGIAEQGGLEVVIIRPSLVYGPGVKANFLRLLDVVKSGIPLPLSNIRNLRSMIYVGNLIDAVITCVRHPRAPGETFLVGDNENTSTPELIRKIAAAMGKRARLMPCPPSFLKVLGRLSGRSCEVERLIGSLCVDSSKIRNTLAWSPPFTMEEGIYETVRWYGSR